MTPRGQRTSPATRRTSPTSPCDFWQATLPAHREPPDNLWYRFIVTDGTDTDYYADDTAALDGGLGAPTDDAVDNSWALMQYAPGFTAPAWAKNAVIYQIFPDRFRNGRKDNDPKTGDVRYDDPVLTLAWGIKPEGYCRNYADGATSCPWRFGTTPPPAARVEQPRGRDYMGGDLKGVDQQLDYLAVAGHQRDLLQPDLRRRLEPLATTPRTTRRSTRTSAPRRTSTTSSSTPTARDPDHPRRRVQPHVVRQPVLRPLPPLRDGRRLRVGRLAVPLLVPLHRGGAGDRPCAGDRRRGLGATTRAGSGSTRSRS